MKLFSTHVSLSKQCRETSRTYKNRGEMVTKRFCYTEPMEINLLYRNQIDDHNYFRHQQIGMDHVWGTMF